MEAPPSSTSPSRPAKAALTTGAKLPRFCDSQPHFQLRFCSDLLHKIEENAYISTCVIYGSGGYVFSIESATLNKAPSTQYSTEVTGLKTGAYYFFKVFAVNQAGASKKPTELGEAVCCKTPQSNFLTFNFKNNLCFSFL